jgi:hypothetical protein
VKFRRTKTYIVTQWKNLEQLAGHGPTLFAGLSERIDLKLASRLEFS